MDVCVCETLSDSSRSPQKRRETTLISYSRLRIRSFTPSVCSDELEVIASISLGEKQSTLAEKPDLLGSIEAH